MLISITLPDLEAIHGALLNASEMTSDDLQTRRLLDVRDRLLNRIGQHRTGDACELAAMARIAHTDLEAMEREESTDYLEIVSAILESLQHGFGDDSDVPTIAFSAAPMEAPEAA